jgi:hypothetical protein
LRKFSSLGKFKNPTFNLEILFLDFGPASSFILLPAQPGPTSSLPVRPCRTELVCFLHFKTCPIRPENLSDPTALPTGRRARTQPTWAHSAQAALAYLPKGVFSSTLRTLAETPSLSRHCHVGPACQLHLLPPPPADRCHSLPPAPRAARPPTFRCQARSSLHAFISPLISLLNPSSSRPTINGIKAITVGRFPLPRPGVPLPSHYKRTRSTPRPSPHSPHPQSLASESAAPTPPSASSADHSSPSPGHVRPSAGPSCSR